MTTNRRLAALAVAVAVLLGSGQWAQAQQFTAASYADLINRIEELEGRLGQMHNASPSCGCESACNECCNDCCQVGGWYAVLENVIVQPFFTRDPAFYVIDSPDVPASNSFVEVPFDWSVRYSPRVEFGNITGCGVGWRIRYWDFNGSVDAFISDTDVTASFGGSDGVDIEFESSGEVTAIHRLQMDVVDLEAAIRRCNLTLTAGVRYAKVEQEYEIFVSDVDAGIFGTHFVEAIGPTIAAEYFQPLNGNLAGFVKLRGSLLYGDSRMLAVNVESGDDIIVRYNEQDLMANVEMQFGVDWRTCLANGSTFYVTAAIETQFWSNAGTGLAGRVDDDDGNYIEESAQEADLGFAGGTIGLGLIY